MEVNSSNAPLVSIISAFYNRSSYVKESIGSILSQTYRNIEVIVVDDGSTDDTGDVLRLIKDPRLRVISQSNTGFTSAMNRALREAQGEIIAVHASGDTSLPTRIEEQVNLLNGRPDVGVVGCWIEDDSNISNTRNVIRPPDGLPFYEALLTRSLFSHGEVMVRREIYDKAGGYRPFFRFAQDRDLWMRVAKDTKYAIVPRVLYKRAKIAGGVSTSPEKLILQAYLSDFAVQCAEGRDAEGRDLLDKYGSLAPFFRHRSARTAQKIGWLGARLMVNGDIKKGWEVVRHARSEYISRPVAIIFLLAATHKFPILWQAIGRPVLRARLRSFER